MAFIGKDTKQPREVEDKDVDWADWMPAGDSIDATLTEVRQLSGDDATPLVVDKVENTANLSKVWLSGGAHGAKYRVTVRMKTLNGREKEAEFDISVKEI